jgi:hypothetical protein
MPGHLAGGTYLHRSTNQPGQDACRIVVNNDHKLIGADVAVLLGTSLEHSIAGVAGRNVGVIAKIPKDVLARLNENAAPK